jgi:hypothetical protein
MITQKDNDFICVSYDDKLKIVEIYNSRNTVGVNYENIDLVIEELQKVKAEING